MTAATPLTIHPHCLTTETYTCVKLYKADITEEYGADALIDLVSQIKAKGGHVLSESDEYLLFDVESGDTPHEYIHYSWEELVASIDIVGPED